MNRVSLFNGVEQGGGKYSKRVYLHYKLNLQCEVIK